jgi:hypothetical protein
MNKIFLIVSISTALCPGCGPGAEAELEAKGAACLSSSTPTPAPSDPILDEKTRDGLLQTCNQSVSVLDTAEGQASER